MRSELPGLRFSTSRSSCQSSPGAVGLALFYSNKQTFDAQDFAETGGWWLGLVGAVAAFIVFLTSGPWWAALLFAVPSGLVVGFVAYAVLWVAGVAYTHWNT
jgi:hypothetical protein